MLCCDGCLSYNRYKTIVKCIGIHCVLARLITKQVDLFTNGRGKWMYLQMIMAETDS